MSGHYRTVHGFPAKMAPSIVIDALVGSEAPGLVLDPMCGSGTVLSEASAHGHPSIGFDLDPLAALIAKVSVTPVDAELITLKGAQVLRRAEESLRTASPKPMLDKRTKRFVEYWFSPTAVKQLRELASCIGRVRDVHVRRALYVAFSSMIIVKENGVSLAADVAHSRPHRVYDKAPVLPFDAFSKAVERVACAAPCDDNVLAPAHVAVGDARRLPLPSAAVDHVLTSPPYLNAIDYMRASRFSLVWMGYDFPATTDRRSVMIGTEVGLANDDTPPWLDGVLRDASVSPELPERQQSIVRRYALDLDSLLQEIRRVLRPGGRLIAVVGDSVVRGHLVSNSSMLASVALRAGLSLESRATRSIPAKHRYLPPPSEGSGEVLAKRMKEEAVLTFTA